MPTPAKPQATIGVFDSGFGGLTVLRALLPKIPGAHYLYLGDTARLPYGAKSQTTIARYAVESAVFLEQSGCDHLVIACNTATALALPEIRAAVRIPVVGVIQPGANALHAALTKAPSSRPESFLLSPKDTSSRPKAAHFAAAVERSLHSPPTPPSLPPQTATPPQVLVLATAATVASHAYRDACAALHLNATEKACPLLVPLVEEGWTGHPVTRDVLRIYLTEALATCNPSAVLLGCTHYPLIAKEIEQTLRNLGSTALIIDSAEATAQTVANLIHQELGILSKAKDPHLAEPHPATFTCYATDSIEKFQRLGSLFLNQPIPSVELLDLGG